jgi:hypothetical protein
MSIWTILFLVAFVGMMAMHLRGHGGHGGHGTGAPTDDRAGGQGHGMHTGGPDHGSRRRGTAEPQRSQSGDARRATRAEHGSRHDHDHDAA